MTNREIRIRGAMTKDERDLVLACIDVYERWHLNDGRGEGLRNCVVWTIPGRHQIAVYHTKTTLVGLYKDDN